MDIKQFITENALTLEVVTAPFNPAMPSETNMFHWTATIKKGNQELTVPFSTGGGCLQVIAKPFVRNYNTGIGPITANDIAKAKEAVSRAYYDFDSKEFRKYGRTSQFEATLFKMLFEPKAPNLETVLECLVVDASVLDCQDFEDWASSFGYDTDSIKARITYDICLALTLKLRNFLGNDKLEELRSIEF